MHIFLFLFPGILLIFSRHFNRKPLSEFLIYVVGLSLSFFVIAPWFIKYLHVPLTIFAYLVFICTLLFLFYGRKKIELQKIKVDRNEMMLAGVFLFIIFLRCLPLFFQSAPAGGEMSMHSYIARLICDNDGIPSSYMPILPLSKFSLFFSGFPTLSALVSLISNMPVYRSSFLMACLAYSFVCFGFYIFLLRFFDRNTSAAISIAATFLTMDPQGMVRWGGNPAVLAFFFFTIAVSLVTGPKNDTSRSNIVLALTALAAALITGPNIFYVGGATFWRSIDARSVILELTAGIPFVVMLIFVLISAKKIFEPRNKPFLIALMVIAFIYYCGFYLYNSVSMCPVTRSDMDAFRWMNTILNKQAVVMNNNGDAGIWIPAAVGMTITTPHIDPAYKKELDANLLKLKPDYIYIGSKAVYPVEIKSQDLEKHPRRYRRVYSNGDAQIWKILR